MIWLTLAGIAVMWLLVGFVAATLFGRAVRRHRACRRHHDTTTSESGAS